MIGNGKPKHKSDVGEGSSIAIDHSSPYYLHPSDFPKQLYVNEVLIDNNYVN